MRKKNILFKDDKIISSFEFKHNEKNSSLFLVQRGKEDYNPENMFYIADENGDSHTNDLGDMADIEYRLYFLLGQQTYITDREEEFIKENPSHYSEKQAEENIGNMRNLRDGYIKLLNDLKKYRKICV